MTMTFTLASLVVLLLLIAFNQLIAKFFSFLNKKFPSREIISSNSTSIFGKVIEILLPIAGFFILFYSNLELLSKIFDDPNVVAFLLTILIVNTYVILTVFGAKKFRMIR